MDSFLFLYKTCGKRPCRGDGGRGEGGRPGPRGEDRPAGKSTAGARQHVWWQSVIPFLFRVLCIGGAVKDGNV